MFKPFNLFKASLFFGLLFFLFPAPAKGEIELEKVEELIFVKCNEKRQKYGLPKYRYDTNLANLARYHSSNMAKYNFFSHTDHQRRSPQKRMLRFYPQILGAVGENIAKNFGLSAEEIAENLVESWMNSPGHRANILSKDYFVVGNGVVAKSDRAKANIDSYYATQNFGNLIAIYQGDFPLVGKPEAEITLPFFFIGGFPPDDLYIYISYPNKKYKHYVKAEAGSYRYYLGGGPYNPLWRKENRFDIELTLDKGLGRYHIKMGDNGKFFPDGLVLEVGE